MEVLDYVPERSLNMRNSTAQQEEVRGMAVLDHIAESDRKAALKICRRYWHPTYNPIMEEIEKLPSVQQEQRWIPVTERLPENDNEVLITVWDAEDDYVEVYKGFYQGHEWWTQWCHGCSKIKDEPCGENIVIAWRPLPEPYRGGEKDDR